jgi:hypothetical protein
MKVSTFLSLIMMALCLARFFSENQQARNEMGITALVAFAGFIAAEIVEQHDQRGGDK